MRVRTVFMIDKDVLKKVKLLAVQMDMSMAGLIRKVLAEYLEKYRDEILG